MTRRSRSKARRRKFVSLRRQLPPPDSAGDDLSDPNVACLLQPTDDAGATITDLLGGLPVEIHNQSTSPSMNCDGDDEELARRALRGRERWELCSPSPSPSPELAGGRGVLSLKLDYEEILAAWSDRGSLYIDDDYSTPQAQAQAQAQAQVVPDLRDPTSTVVFVELGNTWRVPEGREARVMRYKEKRRSRLFAKRIRYQVRKINAEKRPRLKGRFVKKIFDDDT